jgi:hypothetical protein
MQEVGGGWAGIRHLKTYNLYIPHIKPTCFQIMVNVFSNNVSISYIIKNAHSLSATSNKKNTAKSGL